MAIINLNAFTQNELYLVLPVFINLVIIFLGVRQANTAAHSRGRSEIGCDVPSSSSNSKRPDRAAGAARSPLTVSQSSEGALPGATVENRTQVKEIKGKSAKDCAVTSPNPLESLESPEKKPLQRKSKVIKPLSLHEIEDLLDPPTWTGRRFLKIDPYIRLIVKMLTGLAKPTKALKRLLPSYIDTGTFDNVIWEICLTQGFLFKEFGPMNAYVQHYLFMEEPELEGVPCLFSADLATHRVVCLPRRESKVEGLWGLNDEFAFGGFYNEFPKGGKRPLPLDAFVCWINNEEVWLKVADCHFFLEQIDPERRIPFIGNGCMFYTWGLLSGRHERLNSSGCYEGVDDDQERHFDE